MDDQMLDQSSDHRGVLEELKVELEFLYSTLACDANAGQWR